MNKYSSFPEISGYIKDDSTLESTFDLTFGWNDEKRFHNHIPYYFHGIIIIRGKKCDFIAIQIDFLEIAWNLWRA